MHFVAAYQRGTYLAQSKVVAVSMIGDWSGAGDWANDLAILHLEKPIGDIAGFVPLGSLPEGSARQFRPDTGPTRPMCFRWIRIARLPL